MAKNVAEFTEAVKKVYFAAPDEAHVYVNTPSDGLVEVSSIEFDDESERVVIEVE